MTDCSNAKCCKSNCSNKKPSSLGFLVAMFAVVAVGGGAYIYLDSTVFAPTEAQIDTAQQNPGMPHPPKNKMHGNRTESATSGGKTEASKPSTNASDSDQ